MSSIKILSNQDLAGYDYLFKYRKDTYLYDKSTNSYKMLLFDVKCSFRDIKDNSAGLRDDEHQVLSSLFGSCSMYIDSLPFYIALVKDSLNFFYFFVSFAMILWYMEGGYKYATLIVIMVALSIYGEFRDITENIQRIQQMAHYE